MPKDAQATRNESIDPAMVAAITREVIARLQAASKTNDSAASISDRIITVNTIEQLPGSPTQVFIAPGAIVTPAAGDEARRRGIHLQRTIAVPRDQQPSDARLEITDSANPQRASAVREQLDRRGESISSARIVLSDTPAHDVYQRCAERGEIAVMIQSISDVERFADELSPAVWVLDMQRMNIPAAVNTIARIAQIGSPSR